MRILVFGDIFGKKGRQLLSKFLPELKNQYTPDFIVANSENVTNGKGPKLAHIQELAGLGIDVLTGGNHSFANMNDISEYLDSPDSIQIRPANFYESQHYKLPGKGWKIFTKNNKKLAVINLISGNFLKDDVYNPFLKIEEIIAQIKNLDEKVDGKVDGIIIDFHRESTAETYCMTKWVDGKVAMIYGTHTHVQTNDDRISKLGTGAITDVGMSGALESSIGQEFAGWIPTFVSGTSHFSASKEVDMGPGVLCGFVADIEDNRCIRLEKIRLCESTE